MSANVVIFILYLLTGEATMTPVGQYDSAQSCQVVEAVMNAAIGESSVDNAKFKCFDGKTIMEMMAQNGIELR